MKFKIKTIEDLTETKLYQLQKNDILKILDENFFDDLTIDKRNKIEKILDHCKLEIQGIRMYKLKMNAKSYQIIEKENQIIKIILIKEKIKEKNQITEENKMIEENQTIEVGSSEIHNSKEKNNDLEKWIESIDNKLIKKLQMIPEKKTF